MATHEDANLLVQLAQWGAMIDLGMAMGTVFADEFDPEIAESHDPPVQTILAYGETVGTLVKHESASALTLSTRTSRRWRRHRPANPTAAFHRGRRPCAYAAARPGSARTG